MKKLILFLFILAAPGALLVAQKLDKQKAKVVEQLEARFTEYHETAQTIWDYAEVGYQEEKSAALLKSILVDAGFYMEEGVAGIPTAFLASYGSGKPVIAILAEYDALPGVPQDRVPYPQNREDVSAGHACGHHLFGTASTAAAIAVKEWMQKNKIKGTVRLYGTPAEEGGAGKVYMVRAGLFDDADAVLHWHPSSMNAVGMRSSLANKSAKFRFYGQASHAAGAPERGRSALDAVEAMNYMVNMMREHVPMESRIHYVITRGGEAPNVVPAFAEVYYYIRHPQMDVVRALFERVAKAAEGAALGTGTRMEFEVIHGVFNLMPNRVLADLMYANLQTVGGVEYDEGETAFARKIMETFPDKTLSWQDAARIMPFSEDERGTGGSTDVGDISWVAPTMGLGAATWAPGTAAHSWQAVAAGGTTIGSKGMMVAAKTIALTAMDLFDNPELCEQAKAELLKRRGADFQYQPLLGDREPPLDYRK